MHRFLVIVAAVLASATSAQAEPYGGLRLGMTEAEARAILGSIGATDPFDGGYALVGQRPGGLVLGVDICTRNGAPSVSSINEPLGSSLLTFTAAVQEAISQHGQPLWQVASQEATDTASASAAVIARWDAAEGALKVSYVQVGGSGQTYRGLSRPC